MHIVTLGAAVRREPILLEYSSRIGKVSSGPRVL